MTIYEQIKAVLQDKSFAIISSKDFINYISSEYGTNPKSIILSDYCYNRFNKGITFNKHIFQYINKNSYKYLGENYPFTGLIYHKPKNNSKELIVGEWKNGIKIMYDGTLGNSELSIGKDIGGTISREQITKLYEEYNDILRLEMNLLNCKPTELRHLIGRIGEFICAMNTYGELARVTNQHGFDVISNGRRISVKTTAQSQGFISINKNTFNNFDDLYVIQYVDDDFRTLYYGPKESILSIKRDYENKFEVDITKLKNLSCKGIDY